MTKKLPDWRISAPVKIGEKGGSEKSIWTPVGVGFNNGDHGGGASISLRLNLISPSGEYVLFPFEAAKKFVEQL